MSLQDWKQAYLNLDETERREFARWVLDQELGGTSAEQTAEIIPPAVQAAVIARIPSGKKSAEKDWTHVFDAPWFKPALAILVLLAITGSISWQVWSWQKQKQAVLASESEQQRLEREAAQPRSPLNLEFLRANLGCDITVRGKPMAYDVGYLYFSPNRDQSLRLNLFVGNVVLVQSTELHQWIDEGRELAVTGVVEMTDDGILEMRVTRENQIRFIER